MNDLETRLATIEKRQEEIFEELASLNIAIDDLSRAIGQIEEQGYHQQLGQLRDELNRLQQRTE